MDACHTTNHMIGHMGNTRFRTFVLEYEFKKEKPLSNQILSYWRNHPNREDIQNLVYFDYKEEEDAPIVKSIWFMVMKTWVYEIDFRTFDVVLENGDTLFCSDITSAWEHKLNTLKDLPLENKGKVTSWMVDE